MVLHLGDDDTVARLQQVAAKAAGHQIDTFSGTLDEYDLFRRGSVDKLRRFSTHCLHLLRCLGAQGLDTTMHCRIAMAVEVQFAIDHHLRLLRASGTVEVGQRTAR